MSLARRGKPVPGVIVFSDLDGCLLDAERYDHEAAAPALRALAAAGWALVPCTGKSRAELEARVDALGLHQPFIVENGGAIVFPAGAFEEGVPGAVRANGAQVLALGAPRAALIGALRECAAEAQVAVRGFADMSVQDLVRVSGLTPADARLALEREYDEPFTVAHPEELTRLARAAARRGLAIHDGGRFLHLLGGSDKGLAVRTLRALYQRGGFNPYAIGIGDAQTDIALLQAVDRPILMPRSDGRVAPALRAALPAAEQADTPGPAGWNRVVLRLLEDGPTGRALARATR